MVDTWTMFLGLGNSLSLWMDPDSYKDLAATPVSMIAESGDWAVEKRENYATLYRLHIYYQDWGETQIKVCTSVDGGENYSDPEVVFFGTGREGGTVPGTLAIKKVDVMATAKRFRVKVQCDYNAPVAITEIQMELEEQGWIV